jgi:hypothetical protein
VGAFTLGAVGKVSRRPSRALRHQRETARVFRDGPNEVTVMGPIAGDPLDAEAMASMLESLSDYALGCVCQHGAWVDQHGNGVRVEGPIASDPAAVAEALESIARALRTFAGGGRRGGGGGGGAGRAYARSPEKPLRGNRSLADIEPAAVETCVESPLREAA